MIIILDVQDLKPNQEAELAADGGHLPSINLGNNGGSHHKDVTAGN
jgi:hypothetical protein